MALETATYIDGLVATNPAGGDAIAQADDHLRLIKSTLKSTFPNVAGAMTATHTDLNTRLMPSGGIIMWSGASSAIPSGWVLCDGNNSTPDLRGRFVVGAGGVYSVGNTGGNASVTLSTSQLPSHTHSASSTFSGDALGAHSHSGSTDSAGTHKHAAGSGVENGSYLYGYNQTTPRRTATDYNGYEPWTADAGAHAHTFSTSNISAGTPTGTVSTSVGSTGSGSSIDIRNPYYALCYIMKV